MAGISYGGRAVSPDELHPEPWSDTIVPSPRGFIALSLCAPERRANAHRIVALAPSGRRAYRRAVPTPRERVYVIAASAAKAKAAASGLSIAATSPSSLVDAGIYRRAQIETTRTFSSSGTQDGWVLESSHTSSKGGTTSASSTTLRLGDNASRKQYRSVLSFSTGASLPDAAVITKVTLKVRRQGVTGGGNPVTRFGGFMADLRRGYFSTSASLQKGDFQATASRSYGPFKPALVGSWYNIDLTGAKAYVNKASTSSGRTQIRLRFKLDDDNNRTANYLRLYSGNASLSARPQLIVTYYVP